jgi:hypothetical protein
VIADDGQSYAKCGPRMQQPAHAFGPAGNLVWSDFWPKLAGMARNSLQTLNCPTFRLAPGTKRPADGAAIRAIFPNGPGLRPSARQALATGNRLKFPGKSPFG